MASTIYDIEEIELQDGTVITLRPLDIKRLRRTMKIINEMTAKAQEAANPPRDESGELIEQKDEEGNVIPASEFTDDDFLEYLLDAVKIYLEKDAPDLAKSRSKMEEALDTPTLWKILEIGAGIQQTPNLLREAGSLGTI